MGDEILPGPEPQALETWSFYPKLEYSEQLCNSFGGTGFITNLPFG